MYGEYRITELPSLAAVALGDLLPVVDDPAGLPVTKRATVAAVLALAWPVGSVFTSVVATNPADLLGFGTWEAIGAGRVLVGRDAGDPDFDTLEETGGAKAVTLTEAQIPSHTHLTQRYPTATGSNSGYTADTSMNGTPTDNTLATKATGGGQAHTNVQPYLVVNFWTRTA